MSYQKFFITILVKKENIENYEKTFRDRDSGFVEILSYRLWENLDTTWT